MVVCRRVTIALFWLGACWVAGADTKVEAVGGKWKVTRYVSTTRTLDGRDIVKGPFVSRPESMAIEMDSRRYVLTDSGKHTVYSVRGTGRGYTLTRRADGGAVTVTMGGIQRSGQNLRFTTTRSNRARRERYIVTWECVRADEAPVAAGALAGTSWKLLEITYNDDRTVRPARGDDMTLEFAAKGRVAGSAGINRFTGTCRPGPNRSLAFGEFAVTRAANLPGSVADVYLRDLRSVRRYLLDKGMLVLELPYDAGVMKFQRMRGRTE